MGKVPEDWEEANAMLIFKKGEQDGQCCQTNIDLQKIME